MNTLAVFKHECQTILDRQINISQFRSQQQANLAVVGLVVVMAAIVHHPFLQNLILPCYQGHTAGETGGLEMEGAQCGGKMQHMKGGKRRERINTERYTSRRCI